MIMLRSFDAKELIRDQIEDLVDGSSPENDEFVRHELIL